MIGALALLVGGGWLFIKPMIASMTDAGASDYPGPGSGSTEVVISEGDHGTDIANTLVDAGVVKTIDAFRDAFETNPSAETIQAGTYELPQEMRAVDAVAALLDSSYRADVRITIPEGWTANQVYERVSDLMDIPLEEVEDAAEEVGGELPKDAEGNLEGWLAPSTYTVNKDTTAQDVLTEMVKRTNETLDELDVAAEKHQDTLIKASIIEREAPAERYRNEVSRVIVNRLDGCAGDDTLGMDSTVVYDIGKPYSEITKDELESSDYNTRLIPGLPPSPIASPSKGAIEAALNPAKGNWCYFVTVNLETEETKFTDSRKEHDKNRAEYREYLEELRSNSDD